MSSLVTCVLEVAFGVLSENFYDRMVDILKEGDVTDEKCRQWIVRELDNITSKLDDLARKDLLSSISFLKEGVRLLNLSLDQPNYHETAFGCEQIRVPGSMMAEADGSKPGVNVCVNQAFALLQAVRRLNITSEKRFASAKLSFEKANNKATEAFSNKALGTDDRILAAKLRMISRILESLHDPDAAADACKLYLTELHEMPAVRDIFSVHFSGGIKSHFMKKTRLKVIISVIKISGALREFICRFSNTELQMIVWPKIQLQRGEFDPISDIRVEEILRKGFTRERPALLGKRISAAVRWKSDSADFV